jgi:hypothetical protein
VKLEFEAAAAAVELNQIRDLIPEPSHLPPIEGGAESARVGTSAFLGEEKGAKGARI